MVRSSKKGPYIDAKLQTKIEMLNRTNDAQGYSDLGTCVHDLPGDGWAHDRGP